MPATSVVMLGEGINCDIINGPILAVANHRAFYLETITGGSISSLYRNSTRSNDSINATTTNCSQDIMLLARGYEGFSPDNYSQSNIAFASFGSGLSPTEVSNMYNDIQAFQTILSRNI